MAHNTTVEDNVELPGCYVLYSATRYLDAGPSYVCFIRHHCTYSTVRMTAYLWPPYMNRLETSLEHAKLSYRVDAI